MNQTPTSTIQTGYRVDTKVLKQKAFNDFVLFFSMPDPEKVQMFGILPDVKGKIKVPTQKDFALKYGIHEDTITLWKRRKEFVDAVNYTRKQWGLEKVGNVMASLYSRCLKYGMAYDVETYLAYYDNWSRTQNVKVSSEKFDIDDLRSIISSLPEKEQKDTYEKLGSFIALAETIGGSAENKGHATDRPANDQG